MKDSPLINALSDLDTASKERTHEAETIMAALRSNNRTRKRARTLVYRCPNKARDALVEVYQLPAGLLVHQPSYKKSPTVNARTSSESGRAVNTRDGDRHWKGSTYFIEQAINMNLNCDHVDQFLVDVATIKADVDAGVHERVITEDMRATPAYGDVVQ